MPEMIENESQVYFPSITALVNNVSRIIDTKQGEYQSAGIWDIMRLSGTILANLGLSRTIWNYLGLSGIICDNLGLSGTIWNYLGLSGTIWDYLGPSRTRVPIEAVETKLLLF